MSDSCELEFENRAIHSTTAIQELAQPRERSLHNFFLLTIRGALLAGGTLRLVFVSRHQRYREQQLFFGEIAQGDSPFGRQGGLDPRIELISALGVRDQPDLRHVVDLEPHWLQTALAAQPEPRLDRDFSHRLPTLATEDNAAMSRTFSAGERRDKAGQVGERQVGFPKLPRVSQTIDIYRS